MRDNVEAEGPEEYFRKSITVSFLYCTLNEMKTRSTESLDPPLCDLLFVLLFYWLFIYENKFIGCFLINNDL
jgi:hypothetical protein